MLLLSAPHLSKGESVSAYLKRLAEKNQLSSIAMLTTQLHARLETTEDHFAFSDSLLELAHVLEVPVASLRKGAYYPVNKSHVMFNHRHIRRSYLDLKYSKACPLCLREHNVRHMLWDLASFQACPIHRRWLLQGCPSCGPNVRWYSMLNTRCARYACTQDLTKASTLPADNEVIYLMSAIASAAGFPGIRAGVIAAFPEFVHRLPLDDLLGLVIGIGSLEVTGRYSPAFPPQDPQVNRKVAVSAARLLTDWPKNFHAVLNRRIRSRKDRGPQHRKDQKQPSGRMAFYGRALFSEARNPNSVRSAAISKAVGEHVLARFNAYPTWALAKMLDSKQALVAEWQSIDRIRLTTGIMAGSILVDLCNQGRIKHRVEHVGRRLFRWIPRAEIERLRGLCSQEEAARMLRVGGHTVGVLFRAGFLEGERIPGRQKIFIQRESIRCFENGLIARIKRQKKRRRSDNLIRLRTIYRFFKVQKQSGPRNRPILLAVLRAVFSGRLIPRGWDRSLPAFSGLVFCREELLPNVHSSTRRKTRRRLWRGISWRS
jgi:hypothetical protein